MVRTHWWLRSYSSQALERYKLKAECLFLICFGLRFALNCSFWYVLRFLILNLLRLQDAWTAYYRRAETKEERKRTGKQLSKGTLHNTVATASTVDNQLSLTGVADRSFFNRKFLYFHGSRHDTLIQSCRAITVTPPFLLTNFKNTLRKPESVERCENESHSGQTFAHPCRLY